jgi:hypothetical protein
VCRAVAVQARVVWALAALALVAWQAHLYPPACRRLQQSQAAVSQEAEVVQAVVAPVSAGGGVGGPGVYGGAGACMAPVDTYS